MNLFKGIVKIINVQTKNQKKSPISKYNSGNITNIFNFANCLYNNEEHLEKNHINNYKKSEKNISQKNFSHKLSMNKKYDKSQSSRMIQNFSKDKNISTVRKSLFKKNSCNSIGFDFKGQSNRGKCLRNKFLESPPKKYSFFYKLKEKEKNPSKTPYLDKKFWKSSYNLPKYNADNKTIYNDDNKHNNSLIKKNQSIMAKIDNTDDSNKEKNNMKKDSDKKILSNINDDNDIVVKDKMIEKETNKYDNVINSNNENNKNGKKNKKPIIINILNKPFFCCLKSYLII